jgi:hypothetical protein
MIRAVAYLAASGVIWVVEAFLFSKLLSFSAAQVALTVVLYVVLFLVAVVVFVRFAREFKEGTESMPRWRLLSLAPMFVAIVGSFVSLPLLLLVVALGKIA